MLAETDPFDWLFIFFYLITNEIFPGRASFCKGSVFVLKQGKDYNVHSHVVVHSLNPHVYYVHSAHPYLGLDANDLVSSYSQPLLFHGDNVYISLVVSCYIRCPF